MPDVTNASTAVWIDIYTASGITPGTKILIQNKGNDYILIQEKASQPSPSDTSGRMLVRPSEIEIDSGSPGVWTFSYAATNLFVQVR